MERAVPYDHLKLIVEKMLIQAKPGKSLVIFFSCNEDACFQLTLHFHILNTCHKKKNLCMKQRTKISP